MITFQKVHRRLFYWNFTVLCFFCLLNSGCTHTQSFSPFPEKNQQYDADLATLQRADKAFQEKNYQKALEIYSILSQLPQDRTTRRKALYGLACTRLVLAENQTDLNQAIILWDAWSQTVPQKLSGEDPRMLRPILIQKSTIQMPKKQIVIKEDAAENKINSEIIRSKNNEIQRLQNQINIQKKEIEKLNHQINSLEAIDQDILQKKKEISTQ